MTRDEIIRMAREAGFISPCPSDGYMGLAYDRRDGTDTGASLEVFAQLVAASAKAQEREAITDEFWSCLNADTENGVKWLNEKAWEDFKTNYPQLNKFAAWLNARGDI